MNNFSIPPSEFGFDIPARIGMHINDICTPALIVDLDVSEVAVVFPDIAFGR